MPDHIETRDLIVKAIRSELVGPMPIGIEIDCSTEITFEEALGSYGPWKQAGSGEEILLRDSPTTRYGVGVLYPLGTALGAEADEKALIESTLAEELRARDSDTVNDGGYDPLSDSAIKEIEMMQEIDTNVDQGLEGDTDDLAISAANAYRPSSMGVSFLAEFSEGSELVIEASGGRYKKKKVRVVDREYTWWLRNPVSVLARVSAEEILAPHEGKVPVRHFETHNMDGLDIQIEVFSRPRQGTRISLITVCLINRMQKESKAVDDACLFQAGFSARVEASGQGPAILPYPKIEAQRQDPEEQSLELLYRMSETFAVGHGCSAEWDREPRNGRVASVRAEPMPTFETPSITSDITREDDSALTVSMAALAGLDPTSDGFGELREVVELYEKWIAERKHEASSLDERYQDAANRNLAAARRCVARMWDGLEFLRVNTKARKAFELANHAMLIQQLRSRREARVAQFNETSYSLAFTPAYQEHDLRNIKTEQGRWRAFQAAFLLMSLRSSVDPLVEERRTVELIWFPTGGGKTEAYLGLAAFSIFFRRLENINDTGVHVLMRYTLRLLTAQQFQRASILTCAMEYLRRQNEEVLGQGEFSIGIWVGSGSTPNTRNQAIYALKRLRSGSAYESNPFVLLRCPWCGAQMGRYDDKGSRGKHAPKVLGYEREGETVVFKCEDPACDFCGGLPVYIIDEDIYEKKPSLVIGTVDKFAMLAWRPQARALFGLGTDGERQCSPPGLIIQDELHLISGPLGSMVGLYEAVIEELCTDRRPTTPIMPKIVCSTATIRRYDEQVKALYGRDDTILFPAPGLDAGDSFFARYARDGNGRLMPGRKYVGINAPGLGSMQTVQVRTFASALQAPKGLPDEAKDPWWTLLLFFNSLRELGTTVSLFQSDILDYLKVMRNRMGFRQSDMRHLSAPMELTSRLSDDQVPKSIADLEVPVGSSSGWPVDVCLASSIIEVGIDIDRLSLMAVVGQPKTTSQYIQVTGRVGRKWQERPGLVLVLYSASKPRDRSHFEKFRSYHEKLYAQVEPTSVTPFSPPALDRALHAAMVAFARQSGTIDLEPYPFPEVLVRWFRDIMINRVMSVDSNEAANTEYMLEKRSHEWRSWERRQWEKIKNSPEIPLLRMAGAYVSDEASLYSWSTPTSMRNVDAECQAQITYLYLERGR